jgi:hypothetical protein
LQTHHVTPLRFVLFSSFTTSIALRLLGPSQLNEMPVVLTFDLTDYANNDHSRIRTAFERFGWQNLGGSSYRYPRLGTDDQPIEDWMNHVIPALMLFRAFILDRGITLKSYTLDIQSSSGYISENQVGVPPTKAANANSQNKAGPIYPPKDPGKFGKSKLDEWIDGISFPYPLSDSNSEEDAKDPACSD